MKKEKLLLLVLDAAGDKGLSPVQLQKSVFLIQQSIPSQSKEKYAFAPYNYGPFDKHIYLDADELSSNGLVSKERCPDRSWQKYCVTDEGKTSAKAVASAEDEKIVRFVGKIVSWVQSLTFEQLLASVYKKYPEYKINSVFRNLE
ncbi:MAG: hypothetical protein WCG99_03545 [Candidatus Berkelbacteria bacterium]